MWSGSAAEYRHERDNEIVCAECGAKRKDLCRDPNGNVVDGHASRAQYALLEREHEAAEDRAYAIQHQLSDLRTKIRVAEEKRQAARGLPVDEKGNTDGR